MLTLLFIAWVVCGLVSLADLLDRRAERKLRDITQPIYEPLPSNVTPLVTRDGVRVLPAQAVRR